MNPDQRKGVRQLIDEWYGLIMEGKLGAAAAAKKLAALANAHPSDYAAIACQVLEDADLETSDGADTQPPESG